ncbi:CBS domain-containing protein [Citreimonas salinaria]|uniref:CBS domain-containing protein n=1 Tax=Citreimonas salinaria TaxID=321339 RepID=A0A1H3IIV9_9RHOB|nr:CBS domain-containing protein [Citreimonas salinaria]SDY27199.1 CBS domain-containing protein [Citreimonas salinaria]
MQVQNILKSKGSEGVVTVKPGTLVSDVTRTLAEHHIGSVVVSADGKRIDGILSERDIVRELAARGADCLSEPAETYMTRKIHTCARSDSADHVLAAMSEGRFRHMPVVEDGVLVGLITQGDVVKAKLGELAMEKNALEGMIMGH